MPWIGGCDLKRGVAAWIPAATVASGGTAWMGHARPGTSIPANQESPPSRSERNQPTVRRAAWGCGETSV